MATDLVLLDPDAARRLVDGATRRWFAARRARVPGFVDRNYSLRGSVSLHRRAFGWDLVRAPANLLLAAPQLALKLAGRHRRLARLGEFELFFQTDVGRELEWRLYTELLELPYAQGGKAGKARSSQRDSLAETVLDDPGVAALLAPVVESLAAHGGNEDYRERLTGLIAEYVGSRVAASDIATSLCSLAVGGMLTRQFTPGLISLGPLLAQTLAQHAAIASFPLGAGVGGLWYGAFPAAAGPALTMGLTGGLVLAGGALSAFSGIVADPVMRGLGLHRRRLLRLLDQTEQVFTGSSSTHFAVRDHYVARLLDMLDLMRNIRHLAGA